MFSRPYFSSRSTKKSVEFQKIKFLNGSFETSRMHWVQTNGDGRHSSFFSGLDAHLRFRCIFEINCDIKINIPSRVDKPKNDETKTKGAKFHVLTKNWEAKLL